MITIGPNELADDVDVRLSYSNRTLSQAEGAGLDFYTINYCRLATRDFHISSQGQRLFNNCLDNLPLRHSDDARLQFGWNDAHLIRNTPLRLYEYEHLLLASALGEVFPEPYVAAVFNHLSERWENNDRPRPHLSSYQSFAHATNGMLSTTEFPVLLDDRIRLNPHYASDTGDRLKGFNVHPVDLASAIFELGELSQGRRKELTITGGNIIGWLSAFADLFMGIDKTIIDCDGKELHRANPGESPRLLLRLMPPGGVPETGDSIVLKAMDDEHDHYMMIGPPSLTGRVVEQSLLRKVFGHAFSKLDHAETRLFGTALGSIVRIHEIAAESDEKIKGVYASKLGQTLLQTWIDWLPDLHHIEGRMIKARRLSHEDAVQSCNDSMSAIQHLCDCYICHPKDAEVQKQPKDGFCLVVLIETLVKLGIILSSVTPVAGLHPSRAGVLAIYNWQIGRRQSLGQGRYSFVEQLSISEDIWEWADMPRFRNVITVFSGSWPIGVQPCNIVALSYHGICAYSGKLERGHDDGGLIRVTTGSASWRHKVLKEICLGSPPSDLEDGYTWDSAKCDHLEETLFFR